jgi:hypothetical protein
MAIREELKQHIKFSKAVLKQQKIENNHTTAENKFEKEISKNSAKIK